MREFVKINGDDKVAVALKPLPAGSILDVDGTRIQLEEEIPQGHKFALCRIGEGETVVKYGFPIGIATKEILPGAWIHTHNLRTGLGEIGSYCYHPGAAKELRQEEEASFWGYRRVDGRAAVRNEIWIIPTVGCVNNIASAIEKRCQDCVQGTVEAVASFPHPYGCSQMGDDQENTRRILADLINHPNAGGVLVLGLGCENTNIDVLKGYIGAYDENRVKFLVCQESENELEDGVRLVRELSAYAGGFHRERISTGELIIGLKCGGSDGLSGITANPVVGRFSDLLVARGGTTILTEVPEMFGAETLLMDRCADEALFDQTVTMINDFKRFFQSHGLAIYENPSPGNKKGGISTLEDKSLGCIQKSGFAPIKGVLSYGERVARRGLNLLAAPGNDLVASTALAAAGAHMVLFTTGRGTPFASPVPTVKISSNTALYERKGNWIDFNCGSMTEGKGLNELGEALFRHVLEAASGRMVKSEEAGFHDMAIFRQGVTL